MNPTVIHTKKNASLPRLNLLTSDDSGDQIKKNWTGGRGGGGM